MTFNLTISRRLAALGLVLLSSALGACGGGGGGGGSTPTPPTTPDGFPLQAAWKARTLAGSTEEFTVSGSCNGSVVLTAGVPVAADFEGVAGFQASQSSEATLSDCTPASLTTSGSIYVDANYGLVGAVITGQEYAKSAAAPLALPATVKAGDSATVVTLNTYTSSTKLAATGSRTWGYGVEADTATSVIVNFTTKTYNTANQLLATQQARYRLGSTGTLAVVGIDIQYSNTSQNHLVYTPKRVTSVASFALQRAYQARVAAGASDTLTVSGTCSGSSTIVLGTPQAVTFEGAAALRTTQTNTLTLTNCAPSTLVINELFYLDASSTPLGASQVGLDYAKFSTAPTPWPVSAKVGDSGTIANFTTYSSDTKAVTTGRRVMTYVVEADSSTTAIVNVISKSYDTSDQLLLNQQVRYRIDSAGTLELVSIDAQYSTTSTIHLIYTSTRPVGATLKFALLQAYKARLSAGSTERFTVTGSCSGTATLSETAPASTNFEGSTVQATTQTALLNLTNCTPATSAVTGTNYYDTNLLLLGAATPGQEYAKVTGSAVALPAQVQVGDTGTLATLNLYTDNTKAVATGRRVLSFVVEAESVSTAVVNFTARTYNTSDQLLSTQQARYRIDANGTLKLLSIDLQNATTSTLHLVYTPTPGSFTQAPAWPW
jgi:hypothetical protein